MSRTGTDENLCDVSQVGQTRYCSISWEPCVVLGPSRWVRGPSPGLVCAVVLRGRVCVLATAAVAALLQGLLLPLPREARGPKPHLALGQSRKYVTVK